MISQAKMWLFFSLRDSILLHNPAAVLFHNARALSFTFSDYSVFYLSLTWLNIYYWYKNEHYHTDRLILWDYNSIS